MKVETVIWHPAHGWRSFGADGEVQAVADGGGSHGGPSLGIVVADAPPEVARAALRELGDAWNPTAAVGCSTVGQSLDGIVHDGAIVVAIAHLDHGGLVASSVDIERAGGPRRAGRKLAEALAHETVSGCLVFADGRLVDGTSVNGALVAAGLDDVAPRLNVAGALAGDCAAHRSWVIAESGGTWMPAEGWATVVAFTGGIDVGVGSASGWEPFGPERLVTRSYGEILYELDGAPALPLYLEYVGGPIDELPGTASLFPLLLRDLDGRTSVRTVIGVDAETQSLLFAGDVIQGATAQLMCPPVESLIHHAGLAAKQASSGREEFALAISGVGRRRALGQRIEDELDVAREHLAPGARLLGLHSCGELSSLGGSCEFRNETVTMLTMGERHVGTNGARR